MLGEQNGHCLLLDHGKWVCPAAFCTAEHGEVQSRGLSWRRWRLGSAPRACPPHRGTGRAVGPGSTSGAGSRSAGNLDAEVNVCPDEGC